MGKSLKILLIFLLGFLIFSFVFLIPKISFQKFQKIEFFETSQKNTTKNSPKILENLNLEQKVGQLFTIGFEEKEMNPKLQTLIKKIHPGGVLLLKKNIENREQLKKLISELKKIAEEDTGLPLFIAVDQEGGEVCPISFLDCTPPSKIKRENEAFQLGFKRGNALRELGVNLNLAPVLDDSSVKDFIFQRTFQLKSEKAGELAENLIFGQKFGGILTAIKHFPGYGGINFNPETEKFPIFPKIPEISQFQKAIEAKPEMVMVANAIYEEIDKNLPFSLSKRGIEFLKEKLGEDFLIISDDLSTPILKQKFSLEKTILLAKKAGLDILLISGFWDSEDPSRAYNLLFEAVKEGKIPEKDIEKTILKIIKLKENLNY